MAGNQLTLEQLKTLVTSSMRIFYICAGPSGPGDGVELAALLGVPLDAIDIVRHESHDLADLYVYEELVAAFRGL